MGDFNKKFVIREAENILEEFGKKGSEEKKQITNLKNNLKKVKKINIVLKVIIAIMAIGIVMLAL